MPYVQWPKAISGQYFIKYCQVMYYVQWSKAITGQYVIKHYRTMGCGKNRCPLTDFK